MNRERTAFIIGFFGGMLIGLLIGLAVSSWASHTNERAYPSVWIDPKPNDDGYVYREDPCVEALRSAMEGMEPFIPTQFKKDGDLWHASEFLTVDGMQEREEAHQVWEEAKIMCWRH